MPCRKERALACGSLVRPRGDYAMPLDSPSAAPLREPSSLERYELLECIGRGATGEVFRSYDRLTCRMVALKRARPYFPPGEVAAAQVCNMDQTLTDSTAPAVDRTAGVRHGSRDSPAASASPQLPSPLAWEFQLLASLQHPAIVRPLGHGVDHHRQQFLVMDLVVPGLPLDQAARDLPMPRRIELLLQLLQALIYLHHRGVLHRDLKPANVLVSASPHGLQVKLIDFGAAALVRESGSAPLRLVGSMGYLAPELLRGAPASAATELFAVGVMAHELLLGQHPLAQRSRFERLHGFVGSESIFTRDARLSADLSRVLRRALCRDAGERYGDARVFARELEQAAQLPPPQEGPDAAPPRSAQPLHQLPGALSPEREAEDASAL